MRDKPVELKPCLRNPIPEIFEAAHYLDRAVATYVAGNRLLAMEWIRRADIPAIRDWTESLWGKGGPWSRPLKVDEPVPFVAKDLRIRARMPSAAEKSILLARDGFHCRFCGIPLVRKEVREKMRNTFPEALRWDSNKNQEQHAGFQAMWLQYDHLLPHARGGTNELSNMLVTCAPCNFGRSNLTLHEVGLADPRMREPIRSSWDGLERFKA